MTETHTRVSWLAAGLITLLTAAPVSATLIEIDLVAGSGDGLITQDTESGLDWLDVTATAGIGYNAVQSGAGGWFSLGFRHAMGSELCLLFASEGLAGSPCPSQVDNLVTADEILPLIALFGVTQVVPALGTTASAGLYDDGGALVANLVGSAALLAGYPAADAGLVLVSDDEFSTGKSPGDYMGNWLVRASGGLAGGLSEVPEPGTGLLLGGGLAALGCARKRLRRIEAATPS